MHTMWKGSISFGLVNIPIKMHAATEDKDIRFRNIHKECKTPIKYEKVCPNCNKEITQDDIVRGFEYEPGMFVIISDEDLEPLRQSKGKAIEILDFVKLEEIDPIYFIKSYYLSPQDTGEKAYNLLREAMNQSGRIAIAKITIRDKQSLAAVRVYQNLLVMETIFYPDEVRDIAQVPNVPASGKVEVDEKELSMANQLIENLTTSFDPTKYTDEYRKELMDLINKKIEGDEIVQPQAAPQRNVIDLMQALQESLKETEHLKKTDAAPKKKTAAGKKKKETAG
ncbi:MAG TPA: Ku protein [Clostridiales bacterium]|nr:Ku protein [Clostridiales bacterium]